MVFSVFKRWWWWWNEEALINNGLIGCTMKPQLECSVQLWAPHNRKDIEGLEWVQGRELGKGPKHKEKGLENS